MHTSETVIATAAVWRIRQSNSRQKNSKLSPDRFSCNFHKENTGVNLLQVSELNTMNTSEMQSSYEIFNCFTIILRFRGADEFFALELCSLAMHPICSPDKSWKA